MKTVKKSVLVGYTPQEMYQLVTDVARYPQFLPWCSQVRILSTEALGMTAEIGIAFGGIRQSFVTRNTHVPGSQVRLQLVRGPFSQLHGLWDFLPIGEPGQRACQIQLSLNYNFDNFVLSKLIGPVFEKISNSLVDAFVKRAEQVYGR